MKKKKLGLVALLAMSLTLGACGPSTGPSTPTESSPTTSERVTRYTVAFEVDGERYRTESVKEGEKITAVIPNPSKEGWKFIGWFEDGVLVDLSTYVVTKNTTFVAQFEEVLAEDVLSVDDVKEAGKDYYMVLAWWEVADPEDPTKVTSSLTKDTVRLFYGNLIKYLVATGATEENIKNIQFRNYSTAKVAELGKKLTQMVMLISLLVVVQTSSHKQVLYHTTHQMIQNSKQQWVLKQNQDMLLSFKAQAI